MTDASLSETRRFDKSERLKEVEVTIEAAIMPPRTPAGPMEARPDMCGASSDMEDDVHVEATIIESAVGRSGCWFLFLCCCCFFF